MHRAIAQKAAEVICYLEGGAYDALDLLDVTNYILDSSIPEARIQRLIAEARR